MLRFGPLVVLLSLAVPAAARAQSRPAPTSQPVVSKPSAATQELARRVEVLTDEVQKLKEQLVLPEKDEYKSVFGLGPAASRIYRTRRGLSMGGYGEFNLEVKAHDKGKGNNVADLLRIIQYVGYKFTDKLLVNIELEFEHASTGGNWEKETGEVSVEFASLEYLAHPALNIRAGLLLIPMGFINEMHEPLFFHGNVRPEVERRIIPSTWRQLGVGIFGQPLPGLTYKLYGVTGLNGLGISESGWRGARQKGSHEIAEDFAFVLNLAYDWRSILQVASSVYFGGADQGRLANEDNVRTLLFEGHAQLRYAGIELRVLGVYGHVFGATALTNAIYPDSGDPTAPETRLVGSSTYGWYAEVAYDVWPLLSSSALYLAPYFRYEQYDTQASVPTLPGRSANPGSKKRVIEGGLTFKPHPQVVLKAGYRDTDADGSSPADAFYFGAGYIY